MRWVLRDEFSEMGGIFNKKSNSKNVQMCKCASVQVCKCASVQVCKCANVQIDLWASVSLCVTLCQFF
jgi:hypothetical protein